MSKVDAGTDRATHTPGPWVIESSGWSNGSNSGGTIGAVNPNQGTYRIENGTTKLEPRSSTILHYTLSGNGISEEENRANARLIASAPELLSMLEELAQMAEDDAVVLKDGSAWRPFYIAHRDKIRAVITKAKA